MYQKRSSMLTLRFAPHLLQAGTDVSAVQELESRSDVLTTMIYAHGLKVAASCTFSPLDLLALGH